MFHVITAVHNRYNITEKFVKNLISQDYEEGIHLILVDDGSDDGTSSMVNRLIPNLYDVNGDNAAKYLLTIIRGDGTLWWGGALQEGYKWVKKYLANKPTEYIVLANDDTEFASDYYSIADRHLKGVNKTLIAGQGYGLICKIKIDKPVCCDFSWEADDVLVDSIDNDGECASTRSLFMKVEDFIGIGGFHPILLPHYGSDTEWTYRAYKKGYAITSYNDLVFCLNDGEEFTGENSYDTMTLKSMFSKRSTANPFYKICFLVLFSPNKYIFRELCKQFGRYFRKIGILKKISQNR